MAVLSGPNKDKTSVYRAQLRLGGGLKGKSKSGGVRDGVPLSPPEKQFCIRSACHESSIARKAT